MADAQADPAGTVDAVAGRFQFSRPHRRGSNDPWFRIGDVPVGSAALLACGAALSFLVYAIEGRAHPILNRLWLDPDAVTGSFEFWRIVTWPLANQFEIAAQRGIWVAVSIALLWVFGSRLEETTNRVPMVGFLAAVIVVPGIAGVLLDLPEAGIRPVQFVVLLTFIAEYPFARFFFGIPAWALGVVYVAIDFFTLIGDRDGRGLVFYAITIVVAAIAARSIGLLANYPWIPAIPVGRLRHNHPTRSHTGRSRPARKASARRVVEGPWSAPSPPSASSDAVAAQAELDALLDKISATGLDSLTSDEKRRLNELSKRLR